MNDWNQTESDAFNAAVPLSQQAMATSPMDYLDGLNPAQRDAVETLEGPVLMLAGAGTGKTKALTARIAHLLATRSARPNEILAVTFTNKAAREMKTRVGANIGQMVEGVPWMGTFHSICVKLLRRHAELVGLKSNFTILDKDDQLRLLKQLVRAQNIDEKRWPPRMLAGLIDQWKNRGWVPSKVPTAHASEYNNRGTEIYAAYQARLTTLNAVDFGDLLLHMVQIFQNHADVLENTSAGSNIYWSTNTKIPMSPNTCGCACWQPGIKTFVAWVMMTNQFTGGAAPRWVIFCVLSRIFRAQK